MKQMGCISFLPLLNEDEALTDENFPWQVALRSTGSKEHKGLTLWKGDFFSHVLVLERKGVYF